MGWFILFLSFSILLGGRLAGDQRIRDRTGLLLGLAILLAAAYLFLDQAW